MIFRIFGSKPLLVAIAAIIALAVVSSSNAATPTFEVEHGFVKQIKCVDVGQNTTFTIRAKNTSDHTVAVHISPNGLGFSPWARFQLAGAKPSLRGTDTTIGEGAFQTTIKTVYWDKTLQPGQEAMFHITLLVTDWKSFPYPPEYPAPALPYPPTFGYSIRVGDYEGEGSSQYLSATTGYCGVALPPGIGDVMGGGGK
ncbi:MAG: hypothetical protein JWO96_823 [Candidatus Saccharibacteria bacterium]|nr:hypothetical protein [Candidatus Saccharibacteria bacterium]